MVRVASPLPPNNSSSASASSCAAYPQSSPFIHSSTRACNLPYHNYLHSAPVRCQYEYLYECSPPTDPSPHDTTDPLKSAHLTISPSTLPILHNVLKYEYHTRAANPTGLAHSGSLKARIGQLPSLITLIPGKLHHWEGKKGNKKKKRKTRVVNNYFFGFFQPEGDGKMQEDAAKKDREIPQLRIHN